MKNMQQTPARNFVIQLLQERGPLPAENLDAFNFLESGFIDSFALIRFILSIEDEFGIAITPGEMASPRIRTIGGMAELIEGKRQRDTPSRQPDGQPP
jgi:acyl carrier protein